MSAKRLARTEAAAREDELTDIFFKENKIKYFDWVTDCKKCLVIGVLGPYKVDDEASPRIPGSSHSNCRCWRVPSDYADNEEIASKTLLSGVVVANLNKSEDDDSFDEELEGYNNSNIGKST